MQIPILVEPLAGGRFGARTGEPFALNAEGGTAEEAVRLVEQMLVERTRHGAYCVAVNVPNGVPGNRHGIATADDEMSAKDDWFFRELRKEMAENRGREDAADQEQLALKNGDC